MNLKLSERVTELHIVRFFEEVFKVGHFDYLVTSERTATAIIRTLIAYEGQFDFPLEWSQIISSQSLSLLKDDFFENLNVLIFEEMIATGRHLDNYVGAVQEKGGGLVNIVTCALATAENFEDNVDICCFKRLQYDDYVDLRESIVHLLQARGSLLLDTEHTEIEVRPRTYREKILESLAQAGPSVAFPSGPGRTNMTVVKPDLLDLKEEDSDLVELIGQLPEDTFYDNVVYKARVVPRKGENLAVFGIHYPAITTRDLTKEEQEQFPWFLRRFLNNDTGRFYASGIVASTTVLASMIVSLYQYLRDEDFHSLSEPLSYDKSARMPATTSHLAALLPELNVNALQDYLDNVLSTAAKKGIARRSRRSIRHSLQSINWKDSTDQAYLFVQELNRITHEIRSEYGNPDFEVKLTNGELFLIGNNLQYSYAETSVALDRLIDEGYLKTDIERIDGYLHRVFLLDSEVVCKEISKSTMRNGFVHVRANICR